MNFMEESTKLLLSKSPVKVLVLIKMCSVALLFCSLVFLVFAGQCCFHSSASPPPFNSFIIPLCSHYFKVFVCFFHFPSLHLIFRTTFLSLLTPRFCLNFYQKSISDTHIFTLSFSVCAESRPWATSECCK